MVHIAPMLSFSREDDRLGGTLVVAIPVLALVVIHILVTANKPELNLGLVFLYAYATAYLVARTDVRRAFWAERARANGAAD